MTTPTTHTTSDVWVLDTTTLDTPLLSVFRPRLLVMLNQTTQQLLGATVIDDLADLSTFIDTTILAQGSAVPSMIVTDFTLLRFGGSYRAGLLQAPANLPLHYLRAERWLSRLSQAVQARVANRKNQYSLQAYREILAEYLWEHLLAPPLPAPRRGAPPQTGTSVPGATVAPLPAVPILPSAVLPLPAPVSGGLGEARGEGGTPALERALLELRGLPADTALTAVPPSPLTPSAAYGRGAGGEG